MIFLLPVVECSPPDAQVLRIDKETRTSMRACLGFSLYLVALLLALAEGPNFASVQAVDSCATPAFRTAPTFTAGTAPYAIAVGDFNGDGRSDAVVVDSAVATNNIKILLNNGIGGFNDAVSFTAGECPRSVAVGDFNNDGKADLAAANCSAGAVVLLGNGSGGFGAPSNFSAGTNPSFVATGEFNGDGKLDLAVANANSGNTSILLGNGSGSFGTAINYTVGVNPGHISVGDFNNDGKPDLVVVNRNTQNISVLLGDGSGGFGAAINLAVGMAPTAAAVGDFNGDGKMDVALCGVTFNTISILLGNGAGSFTSNTSVITDVNASEIVAGDLNADGKTDLAVAAFLSGTVTVLIGNGTGQFGSSLDFGVGRSPRSIGLADFNGDDKPDLVTANYGAGNVSLLLQSGPGSFLAATSLDTDQNPYSVAAGDFNNDGKPDVAIANRSSQNTSIHLGDGMGGFSGVAPVPSPSGGASVAVGDFNNDNNSDLAVVDSGFGGVRVSLGNGHGGFGIPSTFSSGGFSPSYVAVGDFNNDGNADLVLANSSSNNVSILLGDGTNHFLAPANFATGVSPIAIAVADFNGDGKSDLAVANVTNAGAAPPGVSVLLGNGAGAFGASTIFPTGHRPFSVAVGDLNGDGRADMAVANQEDNNISVLLGNGAGNFGLAKNFAAGNLAESVVISDFNGDGKADLATANFGIFSSTNNGNISVLLGDDLANFSAPTNLDVGANPISLAVADFNTDGHHDVVVANYNSRNASVLLNTCTAAPVTQPTLSINDALLGEGNAGSGQLVFTVSLSGAADKTVTVSYYSASQTATSGLDYQPRSGSLTFAPGVTTQTVSVPLNGDTVDESDETFRVLLTSPLNATINKPFGVGTILNDDPPPSVSINDVTLEEGDSGTRNGSFTVSLSARSGKTITLSYATTDITATGGSDYVGTFGNLQFASGETTKSILVQVKSDTTIEANETFFINLSNVVNATSAQPQGLGTIIDDDLLMLLTEVNSQRGIAMDSVILLRDPFAVINDLNFSLDKRTRVALFATGLKLLPGEDASAVTAEAEDSQHRTYPLQVEYVGKVAGFDWLTQIVVRLPDEIRNVGDVSVIVRLHGIGSNKVFIGLKPS